MSAKPSIVVAVAVDHGGGPVGRPEAGLAGPVRLDDVGDDDQQRVGVRGLGGEQRLGGLAEAGLVGEQERAVARRGRRDHLRLVRHQLQAAGRPPRGRARAASMQDVAALPAYSKDRNSGPSSSQPASRRGRAARWLGGGEVGDEERVGQLARRPPTGARPAARCRHRRRRRPLGLLLGAPRSPAASSISRFSALAASETTASSASSANSEVSRAAVFARIVAIPSSRLSSLGALGLGALRVGLDPGPLLADQQRDRPGTSCAPRASPTRAARRSRPRAPRGRAPG